MLPPHVLRTPVYVAVGIIFPYLTRTGCNCALLLLEKELPASRCFKYTGERAGATAVKLRFIHGRTATGEALKHYKF